MESHAYHLAIHAFSELIERNPKVVAFVSWRSQCSLAVGHYYDALEDCEVILKQESENAWAHLAIALVRSTAPMADLRNGDIAISHLQKFEGLYKGEMTWRMLTICAAVYAEASDFKKAIQYAENAFEKAPDEMKERCSSRIKMYKTETAMRLDFHETQESLAFREMKCHICGADAIFRVQIEAHKHPICCDCNWGPAKNAR